MQNLAGDDTCDRTIREELYLAGAELVRAESEGEVPYSFEGKVGNWRLHRAWRYWIASVDKTIDGLHVDNAMALHNSLNPTSGEKLGEEIRSGGHCGCPAPNEFGASPAYKLSPDGENVLAGSFVSCYHIDTQIGLKSFVEKIKSLD